MESFSLFFVQFETIKNLVICVNCFKFAAIMSHMIITYVELLLLFKFVKINNLCKSFEPILHSNWHFILSIKSALVILWQKSIQLFRLILLVLLSFNLFKPRLNTLEDRRQLLIYFYYEGVIIFTNSLEFRLYYRQSNIVLPRANKAPLWLIR